MTTELALTPAASAIATGAVVRAATRTLVVTGPDIQMLLEAVEVDMAIAPTMEIDSDDMAVELMGMLGRLSTVSSAIDAERKARGEPLRETLQWLMDGYTPSRNMLDGLIAIGKEKLNVYNRAKIAAKQRAEAEAAEARRQEAAAAAQREADAMAAARKIVEDAAKLHDAGSEQVAQALATEAMVAVDTARQEAALAVRAVYSAPARSAPASAVKGSSDIWTAEVMDKAQLVMHIGQRVADGDLSLLGLLDISQPSVNAMAKLQKDHLKLPGVRPVMSTRIAVRKQAVAA